MIFQKSDILKYCTLRLFKEEKGWGEGGNDVITSFVVNMFEYVFE